MNIELIITILLILILFDISSNKKELFQSTKLLPISEKLKYPIYWINLDSKTDRKLHMENQFKTYNITKHTRITAVDGNNIDNNIYFTNSDFIKRTSNPILACLLSHLQSIIKAYNNHLDNVLIMEDDICISIVNQWNFNIDDIIKQAPNDWEILQLNMHKLSYIKQLMKHSDKFVPWIPGYHSTLCYLINKKGIDKMIKNVYRNNRIFIPKNIELPADYFLYTICKTYTYTKPLFIYINNKSSINDQVLSTTIKQNINKSVIMTYYNIDKIDNC
jgi:GR25 family glycosyltransferase involved in LPS biosynthesis